MKIYIAHAKKMNFVDELYVPLREDEFFKEYELILPHEISNTSAHGRDFYNTVDVFIADCSVPATGLGIEIGWAWDDGKTIYCIYKEGCKLNGSIRILTDKIYEYKDSKHMVEIVKQIVKNHNKGKDLC